MAFEGIEGIVKFHISVQRVVLGPYLLLGQRVIERDSDLGLVGEELAQLQVSSHRVAALVILRPLQHALLQSSESIGHVATRHVD